MQSEICALKIAETDFKLASYVPAPVYNLPPSIVIDRYGIDVTSEFYVDSGFEAAYVEGAFFKIGSVQPPNWPRLSNAFLEAGIRHLSDSSVTLDADGNVEKVIDFATHEIELEW